MSTSDRDNNNNATNNNTTIVNGDFEWTSPTYNEEFSVENILCYMLESDKYQSFQIPDNINRMKVVIPNIKNIKPPVIPLSIVILTLEIQLTRNMSYKNYYDGLVSIVKNLIIPSSVTKLYIEFSGVGIKDSKDEILLEILGTDLQVKKSRKINNKDKEKQRNYLVPSSVTKLSLPVVNNDIMEFIPSTVSYLVVENEITSADLIIPPTIEHLQLSYLSIFWRYSLEEIPFDTPDTLLRITCGSRFPKTYRHNMIRNGISLKWIEERKTDISPPMAMYKRFDKDYNLNYLIQNEEENVFYLEIFNSYELAQNGIIPRSIKYLRLHYSDSIVLKHITIRIPSTVVNLITDSCLEANVVIIDQHEYYNVEPKEEFESTFGSTIKKLVLDGSYVIQPYSLPANLQHLVLNNRDCLTAVKGIIPPSVKRIEIGGQLGAFPFQYFPQHLEYLEMNFTTFDKPTISDYLNKVLFHNPQYKDIDSISVDIDKQFYSFSVNSLQVGHNDGTLIIDKFVFKTRKLDFTDYSMPIQVASLKMLKLNVTPPLRDTCIEVLDAGSNFNHKVSTTLLPKSLKQLTLSYELNIDLLSVIDKPLIVKDSKDNINDRFSFSTPIAPGSDTFFYIWRNSYIRNILIDQLVITHGKVFTQAKPVMGSNTLLMNQATATWNISLPAGIEKMVVHSDIYSTLTKTIPPRIAKLLDGQYHVRLKSKPIPSNTSHLIWPSNDVINVGVIPDGVVSIFFHNSFNQPIIPNTIPDSVLSMQFGDKFDIDLEFISFPPKLKYLNLGRNYSKTIKPNCLPSTLKHLSVPSELLKKQQQNYSFIPLSCDHLRIYRRNSNDRETTFKDLPSHISFIKLDISYGERQLHYIYHTKLEIPTTVKSIIASRASMSYLVITTTEPPLQRGPSGLIQETTLNSNSTQSTERLDESIQVTIQIHKNQIIKPNTLIHHITTVKFGKDFNSTILPNTFPESVETIIFGENYNQTIIEGALPSKLKKLVFGWNFNKPITANILPSSLKELEFGVNYQQVLSIDILPASLKKLTFLSGCYNKNLINWIPESVNELIIGFIKSTYINYSHPAAYLLSVDKLPSSITTLRLGDTQSIQSPSLIPSHIKHLRLGPCVEYDKLTSPSSLESLELSKHHNYPLQFLIGSAKDN